MLIEQHRSQTDGHIPRIKSTSRDSFPPSSFKTITLNIPPPPPPHTHILFEFFTTPYDKSTLRRLPIWGPQVVYDPASKDQVSICSHTSTFFKHARGMKDRKVLYKWVIFGEEEGGGGKHDGSLECRGLMDFLGGEEEGGEGKG